jgi:hypothetical protein
MSEPEVAYCDDYEALAASGAIRPLTQPVETKVISAPAQVEAVSSDAPVETA